MKNIVLLTFILSSLQSFSQKLPATWTKEFTLHLSTSGGMEDKSTSINLTYDSCKFEKRVGTVKKLIAFRLNESMRLQVLNKMKEYKLDEIREQKSTVKKLDGENDVICYFTIKEYCVSQGSGSEIIKTEQQGFTGAYSYLYKFAQQKGKL